MNEPLLPTGEVIKSWSPDQVARFKQLQEDPTVWLGYWFSDQDGQAIFGKRLQVSAGPGVVHEVSRAILCTTGLHATRHLMKWGSSLYRCWIVALSGDLQVGDDKACATRREIIGEILPENRGENWRLRITMGERDFSGMDLTGADLSGADLTGENLYRTDLQGANLSGADLTVACLSGANLRGANLRKANLTGANLRWANLTGADLTGADFRGADLTGAKLDKKNYLPLLAPRTST